MTDQTIAVLDYGSGNLRSAAKAFEWVVADEKLPARVMVTREAEDVARADRIVLPGQGAFADCMNGLAALDGMLEALEERVLQRGVPFLGICVGMQLMATRGLEHGMHAGLGWIPGEVVPIRSSDPSLKIPHMGWNDVHCTKEGAAHPVLQGVTKSSGKTPIHFYFVHSFMFECKEVRHMLAYAQYGEKVSAVVGRDNMIGVQFHPEKSQEAGLKLISDFLSWAP
ncbi:MAG: imidazole glycerol phosphate synthase subunit HisH [Rhodospirillales bacterium]|nr:imidazole glycerol phosphate synthase subunit HisH [Alphaproteobacteria bacterium]USO04090.1 MAG: imidazole glycerol phosphate synthase subunit HisH [Rhodospirillales bacterium]